MAADTIYPRTIMRLGPFSIDSHISLSGALAVVLAFIAMVGGWYRFDFRISQDESMISAIQADHIHDLAYQAELKQSIDDLNVTIGRISQRLDDQDRSTYQSSTSTRKYYNTPNQ